MTLEAIRYDPEEKHLWIIDQLKLPQTTEYLSIETLEEGFNAIKDMRVRGAPAIAIVGVFAVSLDAYDYARSSESPSFSQVVDRIHKSLDRIVQSRPTAVNLSNAANDLRKHVTSVAAGPISSLHLVSSVLSFSQKMMELDVSDNKSIGKNGLRWVQSHFESPIGIVTICNTGSLATAGYGTALGVIRSVHESKFLDRAFVLETRPYNQGARLTAFEMVHDKIPATLVTDSMASAVMKHYGNVKVAIVGADRVARNGDTANKIGTYQLAVAARYHGVKFIVAAPTTSIDMDIESGEDIPIEERPAKELTSIQGIPLAAPGIEVWNPSFDVTPHELIDLIVTEKGCIEKVDGRFDLSKDV